MEKANKAAYNTWDQWPPQSGISNIIKFAINKTIFGVSRVPITAGNIFIIARHSNMANYDV
jgi:hypothetical protein